MKFFAHRTSKKGLLLFVFAFCVLYGYPNYNSRKGNNHHPVKYRSNTPLRALIAENDCTVKKSTLLSDFQISANTDTIICFGTNVICSVSNDAGFINPLFEWRKNNILVGANIPYYSTGGLSNGDSIICMVTDGGQQFRSNALKFTVLGVAPIIHISTEHYSCSYSSTASYGFLDLGTSPDDLSFGATTIIPAGTDNRASGLITMPFVFKFAGNDFNKFSVSTNGRMAFGNTVVDSSGNNTDSFGDFTLMPWWDDLTTGTNGNVRYKFFVEKEVITLVIEWNVNASGVNQPFDRTFQVRLVGDANNIIYTYSPNNAITGTGSATVGIAGSNTDFLAALIQSYPQSSITSSVSRTDNNTWLNFPFSNPRGVAFFNSCYMDSIVYGMPLLFTAFIDSLVPSPVYQWKKNNIEVGTNSRFYIDSTLINNDTVTCILTSSTTCFVNSTTSNKIYVSVKPGSYIFFNGNGKWSDPANWSNGEAPPSNIPAGTGIIINPSPGGQCVVDIPVTILRGAQLLIKPGTNFSVQNNLTFL